MGKAIITITHTELKELLGLPDNVEIKSVLSEYHNLCSTSSDNILIKLRGDSLPECGEGQQIERINIKDLTYAS